VGICRMNTSDPAQFDRAPNRPDGLPLTILPLLQLLQVYASSYAGIAYHALMKPAPESSTQLYAGVDGLGIRPEKPLKHLIREQPPPTRQVNDFLRLVE
jgi:hypothetical protein